MSKVLITGCWRLAYKPIYRSPNHLVCSLNSTSMDYISAMFHIFLPSLFLIFLPYSVCKDGFTKTREIRDPEGNGVPSIYRLTHVNFNSQVFVSFLRFFFFITNTPTLENIVFPKCN